MSNTPPPPSTQSQHPPLPQFQAPPTPTVPEVQPTHQAIDDLQRGSDAYTPAPKRVGNVLCSSNNNNNNNIVILQRVLTQNWRSLYHITINPCGIPK
eukprot:scaffold44510_cov84-Cyclotella_meneghiniana.AAC.1